MPIGNAYGPSPTRVEEVDRNGHQHPRLRAPGRFGMAWPGAILHSIPCGRIRTVGHPMAVRSRVHRHRKPSTDVRPSVDDHGGDRSSGRLASISGGRIARRIRLALVDSQGTASRRTDQGADGPRRQDCRPVHCARGHGFLDGRPGLQPLSHPPGPQSAPRLSRTSVLRRSPVLAPDILPARSRLRIAKSGSIERSATPTHTAVFFPASVRLLRTIEVSSEVPSRPGPLHGSSSSLNRSGNSGG